MRLISPHRLWLGHVGDAADVRAVREAGIAAMIDLAVNEAPARVSRETVYCRFPLTDGGGNERPVLRAAIETAAGFIRSGTPTLIFCSAGMSRTPAVAAAAVAVATGRPPGECLAEIAQLGSADVSPRLWAEVLACIAPQDNAAGPLAAADARPTLRTDRLVLRPFAATDAADVARLAGEREIAEMTLRVPHPYRVEDAEGWLATHGAAFARGESVIWAITLRDGDWAGRVIGAIGLELGRAEHARHRAELGFWIGKACWGHGYTTEAGRAVLRYGFETLGLRRIFAYYFAKNPASGRVQEKLGMRREGVLRGHIGKWGEVLDEVATGILKDEWEAWVRQGGVAPTEE
jgi:ribosomal-protein-alanine N-acetyltransferase